jgi:hypothetical protein
MSQRADLPDGGRAFHRPSPPARYGELMNWHAYAATIGAL